jgi:hypothetical protein
MSDRASKALTKGFLPGERQVYDVISNREDVPLSTLNHRALGRGSKEQRLKASNISLRRKK